MAKRNVGRRSRANRNTFVTHTGTSIRVNRSFGDSLKNYRDSRSRSRANRLSTLPKGYLKRLIYRLQPKRLAAYWFSRDGAIMALKVMGVGIVVVFVLAIGLFAYFRKDLPKLNDISGGNIGGSISYYDRTGNVLLWQDYNAVKRIPVHGNQISQYMKDATVAIEDKNFYHEGGFSISGILRAGFHDLFGGSNLQGASTITEQVVKLNEGWIGNRSIPTKIKEVILSVDLAREYSKDTILTGYLNVAPYGGVDYGIQAAAQDYFNENASQLTLAQSAMLAAIPQAPTYYSPYSSPQYNSSASANLFGEQALVTRKNYILDQMALQHYITQAQARAAKKVDVLSQIHPMQTKYAGIKDPYFVLAAKQELLQKYGAATVNRGGWKVITTMDVNAQNQAEQLVANNVANVTRAGGDQQALVAEQAPTGQIVADVGGENFNNPNYGQINFTETPLSPGSSFKPYDYASLINNNNHVGAGSVLYDIKQPMPGYPCTNNLQPDKGGNCLEDYDFKYPGAETLRYALAGSRNIPAAKTMLEVVPSSGCAQLNVADCVPSINKTIQTADSMMHSPNAYQCYTDASLATATQCYAASSFGYGAYLTLVNHVNGDSTLARMGASIPSTFILKIVDSNNKTLYQWTQPKPTQAIRTDAAYIVDNMLSDPRATYLPGACTATTCTPLSSSGYKFQRTNGWDVAVKTGTTTSDDSGLMTAWTTQYAVVSWVGNAVTQTSLTPQYGGLEGLTEPLTRGLITDLIGNQRPVNWTQPSDIKVLPAYIQRTHIDYGDEEPGPSTDLFPAWYVGGTSGSSTSETIDKVSGGVATSCTPALAKEVVGNANVASWNIDMFNGGSPNIGGTSSSSSSNAAPAITDNVHSCSDVPPSVTLTQSDCAEPDHCNYTVAVTQGTHALSGGSYTTAPAGSISLLVNGQNVQTVNIPTGTSNPYSYTFSNISVSNGNTIEAQVVDSVLYSGTSTITASGVPTTPTGISGLSATSSGATTTITWTGGQQPFTVVDGGTGGTGTTTTCSSGSACSVSSTQFPSGSTVTVTDSNSSSQTTTIN